MASDTLTGRAPVSFDALTASGSFIHCVRSTLMGVTGAVALIHIRLN